MIQHAEVAQAVARLRAVSGFRDDLFDPGTFQCADDGIDRLEFLPGGIGIRRRGGIEQVQPFALFESTVKFFFVEHIYYGNVRTHLS